MLAAARPLAVEVVMPVWVCSKCKQEIDARCRPATCPKCGASKDAFGKKEEAAKAPPKRCC